MWLSEYAKHFTAEPSAISIQLLWGDRSASPDKLPISPYANLTTSKNLVVGLQDAHTASEQDHSPPILFFRPLTTSIAHPPLRKQCFFIVQIAKPSGAKQYAVMLATPTNPTDMQARLQVRKF